MTNDALALTLLGGYAAIGTAWWKTISWLRSSVDRKDKLLDDRDNWIKQLVNGDRRATLESLSCICTGQDRLLAEIKGLVEATHTTADAAARAAVEAAATVASSVIAAGEVTHARQEQLHTEEIALLKGMATGIAHACEKAAREG